MRNWPLPLGGAVLAGVLSVALARADERWVEIRSPHFRVVTDASEKEGREITIGFEQLRRLFQGLGNMRVDPPAPIVIVATRNEAGMRAFMPWYWERRGGLRPGGAFLSLPGTDKHHIALRLDVPPDFRDHVVFHEYVHLVVDLNFASLPLWLNEGLAEFYATTTVQKDKVRFGRVDADRLAVLRQRAPLPLADLFAIDGGSREYNEQNRASVLYAESALLTHYFLIGERGAHRGQLQAYLRLLSEGASSEQAQAQAFGDLKALQKSFFKYVHQYQFMAIEAPLDGSAAATTVRPLGEAEVLALRGDFLARYGREAEARPLLVKAREMDPRLALAAQGLGLLEARAGRPADARRHLADAISLAPDDFASHYLWAQAAVPGAGKDDLAASEAALRRSVQLNPTFAPGHALLSAVLRRRGELEPAFLSLHKACELEPNSAAYWVQRADLLRDLKRPDVAEAIETQLARSAPSDPEQLQTLAAYYRAEKRLDDLQRLLRKAADLNPRSSLAPMMLGRHLADAGRGDEAEAAFRRALAAQPDNPSILNTLAYHNADRNVKLPESLELVDRALKVLPESGAMLDTKGWALFRMGRLEEAEKFLRRALERRDDPDVLEHLGDVLAARGQRPAAQEMWKRALDHPEATDARKEALRQKVGSSPHPRPEARADRACPGPHESSRAAQDAKFMRSRVSVRRGKRDPSAGFPSTAGRVPTARGLQGGRHLEDS